MFHEIYSIELLERGFRASFFLVARATTSEKDTIMNAEKEIGYLGRFEYESTVRTFATSRINDLGVPVLTARKSLERLYHYRCDCGHLARTLDKAEEPFYCGRKGCSKLIPN